jgi:putative flippase GtrA
MAGAVRKLWAMLTSPEGMKLVRYSAVSVVSVITSATLLTIFFGLLRLGSEVWCTLAANVIAGGVSYVLYRRWVWKKGGRSHLWREVVPFWVMSFTGLGFALVAANLAKSFSTAHDLQHLTRTIVVLGANYAAFGIVWLLKFLVLNRLFAQIAEAELHDDELTGSTHA